MDVIRSCYSVPMKFKESDGSKMVQWMFAAPDAEIFSAPTVFRSANWESSPYQNDGLGEQRPSNRPWRNGARPAGFTGRGPGCNFASDWWVEGVPEQTSFVVLKDATGVPLCCGASFGALLLGGDVSATPRGPGAPVGSLLLNGDASTTFTILPGSLLLAGDSEVHVHPPAVIITPCCPAGVPPVLTATFLPPIAGPLQGFTMPLTYDGVSTWVGNAVYGLVHNIHIEFLCLGGDALGWFAQGNVDGVAFNFGQFTDLGAACAPLFTHFTGFFFGPPGQTGTVPMTVTP